MRTVLYFTPHPAPFVYQEELRRPQKSDLSDVVFFGSETQAGVHERFWLSPDWLSPDKGKLDFLEMWSGKDHLSLRSSQLGLSTGSPMDTETGYDLNTFGGQSKAWKIIHERQP